MSTHSAVGYVDDNDQFRGTYVHFDGYPDHAIPEIEMMLAKRGFDEVKNWIEAGIQGNGYSSYDSADPYNDGPKDKPAKPWTKEDTAIEYCYEIHPDNTVELIS